MPENHETKAETPANTTVWIVTVGLFLLAMVAIAGYSVSDNAQAESGSPLYDFAVHEALRTLQEPGAEVPVVQGEVCPDCGKIHPPAQHSNADAGQAGRLPRATPAPVGVAMRAGGYYYCENCKAYHKVQPGLAVPPGAPQSPPIPAQEIVVPPLLPAGALQDSLPPPAPAPNKEPDHITKPPLLPIPAPEH